MDGKIKLMLSSAADTSGFSAVSSAAKRALGDTSDLAKGAGKLGAAFGTVGGLAGSLANSLLKGGIWEIAASGVRTLISLWRDHKEAVKAAAEEERKSMDAATEAVSRHMEAVKNDAAAAVSAQKAASAAARERAAAILKVQTAELELRRQKDIAAGVDVETADRDYARGERFARHAAQSRNEREAVKDAEEAVKIQKKLLGDYGRAIDLLNERAANARARAASQNDRGNAESAAALMDSAAKANADIAALQGKMAEARRTLVALERTLQNARRARVAGDAAREAESLKAENDARAAEAAKKKAAEERAEAERRAAAAAAKRAEDEAKRAAAEAARRAARKKAEDDADARAARARADAAKKIAGIEAEIARLKGRAAQADAEAARLEENAARARGGKTFGEWQRGERRLANDQRRREIRQNNVVDAAKREVAALENERRHFGRAFSPARAARLAKLREFIADQDPENNPALRAARAARREAERLEKERDAVRKRMADDLDQIRRELKEALTI